MSTDTELKTQFYTCFTVKLDNITVKAIQEIFEQAFYAKRANPMYLFCNEEDHKALDTDVAKTTSRIVGQEKNEAASPRVAAIANQTTGRLVPVVDLPDLELGTLLFGFFAF